MSIKRRAVPVLL